MNEVDLKDLPQAACALIVNTDGEILGVSRKDNPADFGLPGGKVDPGETHTQAMIRELKEETGLDAKEYRCVYIARSTNYCTHTFLVTKYSGDIKTNEQGFVQWVTADVLENGCFGDYNRRLFSKLGF